MPALAAPSPRLSPLDDSHRSLGARMVEFGGWEMPLSYPAGTVAEHLACRSDAVAFDVSHLGTVRVEGSGSFNRLQSTLTNDLRRIGPGRAQYTHLLDPDDASVLDDLIIWWIAEDTFEVMPNASNTDEVRASVGGNDVTASRAVIAVQGPRARSVVAQISPEAAAVKRFCVVRVRWGGVGLTVAGTGYTGEDGLECSVPAESAASLWSALLAAGVQPAGLGARDTLRLEAALPLHGHELGAGITPLQAGLGWVVSWEKSEGFRGREALEVERKEGVRRRLGGIVTSGRRPPREGSNVMLGEQQIAKVTSGNYSPVLGEGIALALLPTTATSALTAGSGELTVEVRGSRLSARSVPLPFITRRKA